MTEAERLGIEQACRDLIIRFGCLSDTGEYEASLACFTPDGIWVRGGKPMVGHDGLMRFFRARPPGKLTRHLVANMMIDVDGEASARGLTYFTSYVHDSGSKALTLPVPLGAPFSVGEWHDKFVHTADGWRIAHRETKRLLHRPAGA